MPGFQPLWPRTSRSNGPGFAVRAPAPERGRSAEVIVSMGIVSPAEQKAASIVAAALREDARAQVGVNAI